MSGLQVDLQGRRALITGASSGFGAHFARVLASAGAEVILTARRTAALDESVARLRADGRSASAFALDVRDDLSIGRLWNTVGAVDILVNNAGVTVTKPVLDQDAADWASVVDTDLRGAFLVATGAARKMRDAGKPGSIINIASILGLRVAARVAAYAIAKAGVIQMTRVLALELARYGIRANTICPGYFATPLNQEFFDTAAGQALVQRVPQRRLGEPAELDGPLLLLASDASSFMTGTELVVDGGHLVSSL